MNEPPRIWVDWNYFWEGDVFGLECPGTKADFEQLGISIREGLKIRLYGDDLEADAIIIRYECNNHNFLCAKVVEGTMINMPIN